jgi:hypothetical protein
MNYSSYFESRNKWDDEDKQLTPLRLDRKRVIIELEVDATVTDYNAHQIVLSHSSMDGTLMFDVENLEEAEDTLDELQMEASAQLELELEEPEPVKKPEPVKTQEFIAKPPPTYYLPPKPQVKPEPKPETPPPSPPKPPEPPRQMPRPQELVEPDPETNPFMSIIADISEICNLVVKSKPKVDAIRSRLK